MNYTKWLLLAALFTSHIIPFSDPRPINFSPATKALYQALPTSAKQWFYKKAIEKGDAQAILAWKEAGASTTPHIHKHIADCLVDPEKRDRVASVVFMNNKEKSGLEQSTLAQVINFHPHLEYNLLVKAATGVECPTKNNPIVFYGTRRDNSLLKLILNDPRTHLSQATVSSLVHAAWATRNNEGIRLLINHPG